MPDLDLICDRGVFGVLGGDLEEPVSEVDALASYQRHLVWCEECDPGASRLCRRGQIRHNRWATAQAAQRFRG